MSLTFLQLKQKLRVELWPAGEAKNLQKAHDAYFIGAVIDLQRWIECLQVNNVSTFKQCATYWECAKTVVEAPKGVIKRVFTIANNKWCDKVFYWQTTYNEVECWSRNLVQAVAPTNTGLAVLQQGYKFADSSSDLATDGTAWGRARIGTWAIHNRRLYTAPWLQSNETLVVEWDGKKDTWDDTDVLNAKYWTPSHEEAIKLYVKSQHEVYFGDKQQGRQLEMMYREKVSDLIFDCREETRERLNEVCSDNTVKSPSQDELNDDAIPTETSEFVHAFVADWGQTGTPLDNIETQILNLKPRYLFLGGDNVYSAGQAATLFARFSGISKIFAFGNHDHDYAPGDLSALLALVEQNGNERYFSVVDGSVQYFILDTDSRETDGGYTDANTTTESSVMGEWLRVRLALSTAKWKVVIGHHGPYMSDSNYTPGNKWMRWPFALWGADLYINGHGHNFEHVQVADFDYMTCGLGGHSIRAFGANTTGTILKQFNSDYAFLKLTSTCSALTLKLIDRVGTEQYSYELTK